jgi:hypothetical protein
MDLGLSGQLAAILGTASTIGTVLGIPGSSIVGGISGFIGGHIGSGGLMGGLLGMLGFDNATIDQMGFGVGSPFGSPLSEIPGLTETDLMDIGIPGTPFGHTESSSIAGGGFSGFGGQGGPGTASGGDAGPGGGTTDGGVGPDGGV